MILYGDANRARNAVHLLNTGEKVKATQLESHPAFTCSGRDAWPGLLGDTGPGSGANEIESLPR